MNSGFPEGWAAHMLFANLHIWDGDAEISEMSYDLYIYIYKISFLISCMSLSELEYDKLSQSEINGER